MSDTSDSEGDSDRELQVALAKGLIKGKLVTGVETKKQVINNKIALQEVLDDIKSSLPWIERLDLTVKPVAPPNPLLDQLGSDPDDLNGDEVHNDFKREFRFHRQAQAAVLEGIPRLRSLGVPTRRPDDFFAEMCKSDDHMKRVREKLVTAQLRIERSEKVKKLREMRKYGKKVQQEVKIRRQKEKKQFTDAIKNYRKGKEKSLDFLDDKKSKQGSNRPSAENNKKQVFQPNKKRQRKNEKFGFGGQKKRSKSNNADSVDDVSSFSARRNAANPAKFKKFKKGKNNSRPGKSKRQQMKNKKR